MATDLLPDLNALVCYALVLACGGLSAYWQISDRFKSFPAVWGMLGTWTMLLAFTAVPVGLFLILDRTGAIHDTSLFAALLVGFGYQQILSGQISTAKAPSDVSSLWQPFVRWSDWMAARINDRVAREESRFTEKLIAEAVKDDKKLAALRTLTLEHAANPAKLAIEIDNMQKDSETLEEDPKFAALRNLELDCPADKKKLATELDKMKTNFKSPGLGAEVIRDRQARKLYFELKANPDYQYLLVKDGILTPLEFYWRSGRFKAGAIAYGLTAAAALLFLFPFGAALAAYARNAYPPYLSYFYVWRVAKANTTDADKFRTNEQLVAYLSDPKMAGPVCSALSSLLRYEPLSTNAADRDLAILLAGNPTGAKCHEQLHDHLIDALRAQNADIRSRVNESLVWLYSQDRGESKVPDELKNWKPKASEAAYVIENYISKWRQAWSSPPAVKSQPPSPAKSAASLPSGADLDDRGARAA